MVIYSAWPFFACMALLFGIAASPVFKLADKPPSNRPDRIIALDGLRGILALDVYFHHASVNFYFMTSGSWELPPSRFYTLLGQGAVSVFFMITGYLFWCRLIEEKGRPDWAKLYIGRIFRIAPLYLFAIAMMFVIVAVRSGFVVAVPFDLLEGQLLRWLSLGLFVANLNGVRANDILAGVTWSLRYEWIFYICLPLIALVAAQKRLQLPFTAIALLCAMILLVIYESPLAAYAAQFLAGMICASAPRLAMEEAWRNGAASVLMLGLLAITFTVANTSFSILPIACLGAAFYLVISGCSFFGLLNTRAAHRLGDVSYGIYLLQGLVLTLAVTPISFWVGASKHPGYYWSAVLAGGVILVMSAMVTHVLIERPGIKAGRFVAARLRFGRRVDSHSEREVPSG